MVTKDELAILLLKLIGFYLIAVTALRLPQYIITYGPMLMAPSAGGPAGSFLSGQIWGVFVGVAAHVIGGILIVFNSRGIAKWLLNVGNTISKDYE